MTYLQYLTQLSGKEYSNQNPGTARVKQVLELLGNPQNKFPVIHIAGTNGKGSVSATLHNILLNAGYKTGLYTSPHLTDFRERIKINNTLISKPGFIKIFKQVKQLTDKHNIELTYFEFLTTVMFKYFCEKKVDIAVVETGLGGRYDATNVVTNPVLTIITSISLDHTELMGNTLLQIAKEKAGIIKPAVPLILAPQQDIVNKLIYSVSKKNNTPVYQLGRQFNYTPVRTGKLQVFHYSGINLKLNNLKYSLIGQHQFINGSIAIAGIELLMKLHGLKTRDISYFRIPRSGILPAPFGAGCRKKQGYKITHKHIISGLKTVSWRGRFEFTEISHGKKKYPVILDGAHNPAGITALTKTIQQLYRHEKLDIIMSIMKEKDYPSMCRIISPVINKLFLYKLNIPRALPPELLKKEFSKYLPEKNISVINNVKSGITANPGKLPKLITGSLYFIGDTINRLGLCLLLVLGTGLPAYSTITDSRLKLNAEFIEYFEKNNYITAKQNVVFSSGSFSVKSNSLSINMKTSNLVSTETVTMIDKGTTLVSRGINYNFSEGTGILQNSMGYFTPWYFYSNKLIKQNEIYLCKKTRITTCNAEHPHYFLSSNNAKLKPGKSISMTNMVFKAGPVPVFYFPYYYASLKKRQDVWEIYPGYDSRNGLTAKIMYGFPVTENTYTKLYFDNYSLQGIGKGIEYNYNLKNRLNNDTTTKGTLFLYQIHENETNIDRWNAKATHWQQLSPTWSLQGNMDYTSDPMYNNYYYKENWYWANNELKSFIGLTKQTNKVNLRFSAYDIVNSTSIDTYYQKEYSAPKFEFTLLPIRLKPTLFYLGMSDTSVEQYYNYQNNFTQLTGKYNFYLYRRIQLLDSLSLTPRAGIIESWQNRNTSQNDPLFQNRYYTYSVLRQQLGSFSMIDFVYDYQQRMRQNEYTEQQTESDDYGIETNKLRVSLFSLPTNNIYIRISNGYDFRMFRSQPVFEWTAKFDPITTELNLSYNKFNLYFREEQSVKPFAFSRLQTDFSYNNGDFTSNIGLFYNDLTPFIFQARLALSFWVAKKWKFTVSQIGNYNSNTNILEFQEQKIDIYKDMHCWQSWISYIKRGAIEQYLFNIGLKFSGINGSQPENMNMEKQFYPWR